MGLASCGPLPWHPPQEPPPPLASPASFDSVGRPGTASSWCWARKGW